MQLFLVTLGPARLQVSFVLHHSTSGGVGHGPKGIMGKKSKTAHLHLTFALFTSLVSHKNTGRNSVIWALQVFFRF